MLDPTLSLELWQLALLAGVGVAGGFLNVMAGGGSLLMVPVMVFMGIPGPVKVPGRFLGGRPGKVLEIPGDSLKIPWGFLGCTWSVPGHPWGVLGQIESVPRVHVSATDHCVMYTM